MCFGNKRNLEEVEVVPSYVYMIDSMRTHHTSAYRIPRQDDSPHGYHDRRRSSVQRHLDKAPAPIPRPNGSRYPKEYQNRSEEYPSGITYYEYPTMDYPWGQQNYKGKVKRKNKDNSITEISPMYTRTITDSKKIIQGVSYHPHGDTRRLVRAEEIHPSR